MATTDLLEITYPDENENPFFESHAQGMGELDAWLAMILEAASLLVYSEAEIALNYEGDAISWDAPIYLVSPRTGHKVTIPAGVTALADGEIASLTGMTWPLADGTMSTFVHTTGGPVWDAAIYPIFYRSGANVWLLKRTAGLEWLTLTPPVPPPEGPE
jgi:hypothetical protein